RRIDQLQAEVAKGAAQDVLKDVREVGGVKVLATKLSGDLRKQADHLRERLGTSVVVLASVNDGQVGLLVGATKDLDGRVHAGKVIGEIAPMVGGRGGG